MRIKRLELVENFWKHVIKGRYFECWKWTGSVDLPQRRPWIWFKDYTDQEHPRWRHLNAMRGYVIGHYGQLRADQHVLHKCHNSMCVNPYHVYVGNKHENAMDAILDGWRPAWPLPGAPRKVTPEIEHNIISLNSSGMSQASLAAIYHLHFTTVCRIVNKTFHAADRRKYNESRVA